MTKGRAIILVLIVGLIGFFILQLAIHSGGSSGELVREVLSDPSDASSDAVVQYVLSDDVPVGDRVEVVNAVMGDQMFPSDLSLQLASRLESMHELVQRSVLRNYSLMQEISGEVAKEISGYLERHAPENDDRTWFAAQALGNVSGKVVDGDIIESLLRALDVKDNVMGGDNGPQLRNYAADALGDIGRPDPNAVDRLIAKFISVEDVDDSVFRVKCARALLRMGVVDERIVGYLEHVATSGKSEYVRSMAEAALEAPRHNAPE